MIGRGSVRAWALWRAGLLVLGAASFAPPSPAEIEVLGAQTRGIDLIGTVVVAGSPSDTQQATRLADPNDPGLFSESDAVAASVPGVGVAEARAAHASSLNPDPATNSFEATACAWGDLTTSIHEPAATSSSEGRARSFYQMDLEVRDAPAPFDLRLRLLSGLDRFEGPRPASLAPHARISLAETDLGLRIIDATLTDAAADHVVTDHERRFRGTLLPGHYRLSAMADVNGTVTQEGRGEGFAAFEVTFTVPEPRTGWVLAASLLVLRRASGGRGRPQSRSIA